MLLDQCYKAVGNAYVRKKHEVSTNQRLLDKQEKIDSICNNLKAQQEEGGAENAEELQIQLQEINDMVSCFYDQAHFCTFLMLIYSARIKNLEKNFWTCPT